MNSLWLRQCSPSESSTNDFAPRVYFAAAAIWLYGVIFNGQALPDDPSNNDLFLRGGPPARPELATIANHQRRGSTGPFFDAAMVAHLQKHPPTQPAFATRAIQRRFGFTEPPPRRSQCSPTWPCSICSGFATVCFDAASVGQANNSRMMWCVRLVGAIWCTLIRYAFCRIRFSMCLPGGSRGAHRRRGVVCGHGGGLGTATERGSGTVLGPCWFAFRVVVFVVLLQAFSRAMFFFRCCPARRFGRHAGRLR